MKILGLEFSSAERSAFVLDAGAPEAAAVHSAGGAGTGAGEEELGNLASPMAMIERALERAKADRDSIGLAAVGLGPGSYAGIRTAIAIVQGWRLAKPIRTAGISSMRCVAHQVLASGWAGMLDVVVDAQRGEFYLASYQLAAARVEEAAPLRIASRDEVQAQLRAGHRVAGPGMAQTFPGAINMAPCASMVCRLARDLPEAACLEPDLLEPICLRPAAFVKAPRPRQY